MELSVSEVAREFGVLPSEARRELMLWPRLVSDVLLVRRYLQLREAWDSGDEAAMQRCRQHPLWPYLERAVLAELKGLKDEQ